MRERIGLFILALLWSLGSFSQGDVSHLKPQEASFRIIGFYKGNATDIEKYEIEKLTHIIFCFTHLKGNKIAIDNENDEKTLIRLAALKTKYPKLKVLVSLGGWGGCESCSEIFSSDSNRKAFAASVKALLVKYHCDGLDLDWESPVIGGYKNHPAKPEDRNNFTSLVIALRQFLPPPYEISFDANSFPEYLLQSIDWEKVIPQVNFVNLMTYGLPNDKPRHTGHHTALYSSSYQKESVQSGVKLLDSLKVQRSKIVIGAAFYGFVVQNVDSLNFGLGRPGKSKNAPTYSDIINNYTAGKGYITHWDTVAMAPYLYSQAERTFVTFDNKESCRLKTEYAIKEKLGGIMFWKLNGDTYNDGLLDAIYRQIHKGN